MWIRFENIRYIYTTVHWIGVIKDVCDNMRMQGMDYFKGHVLFYEVGWACTLTHSLYVVLFVTELLFLAEYGPQLPKIDT